MTYTVSEYISDNPTPAAICELDALYGQLLGKRSRREPLTALDIRCYLAYGDLWVGRSDETIVAMGLVIPNMKPLIGESFGSIHDVVTDVSHRGKVLGGQSLAELILRGIIENATQYRYLELTSKPDRVAANRLYQKLGFKLIASGDTNLYRFYLNSGEFADGTNHHHPAQ